MWASLELGAADKMRGGWPIAGLYVVITGDNVLR